MMARFWMAVVVLSASIAATGAGWAQPPLATNESEIAAVIDAPPLAIDDPLAVFDHVLKSLPERVRVFPTENYYYFRFTYRGVIYAGNIRLAAADRDQGKVNVSYNERPTDWNANPKNYSALLGPEQEVSVEKTAPLTYRVAHAGTSVTFALNDLSGVKPPPGLLRADEKLIGPIFDESGIRFFLVFNARLKIFHFLLDQTAPPADQFTALPGQVPIEIGKRTGFAFYDFDGRKILVGVNERQSRLNSYFDGPFDQLPENFIEGETLRDAIIAASPDVKGKIDRLGNFNDGTSRYLIHPYLLYRQAGDLAVFRRCVASKAVAAADRAACFVIGDDEAQGKNPRPLALKRR